MTNMSKFKFYFLSFTWGLPVTLLGCLASLGALICGKKPKKWGYCWYFEFGKNWGGTELGIFFFKDTSNSRHIKNHEHGHALQNCYWETKCQWEVAIFWGWLSGWEVERHQM